MVESMFDLHPEHRSISCQADVLLDEQLGEWVFTTLGQIAGDKYLLGRSLRMLFRPFPVITQKIENHPSSQTG